MKRFVLALTLVCVLSSTTLAGLIPTTDVTPPPPPPDKITTTGDIPSGGVTSPGESPGDIPAVDLWLTVLGLVF